MIGCVDCDYRDDGTTAAGVAFAEWTSQRATIELVIRSSDPPAPYRSGAFYERELPFVVAIIDRLRPLDLVIVDGYVWLGPERPGLGWYVHDRTKLPIVGVAKTRFEGAAAIEVMRGTSARPLYVTAVGCDAADAANHLRTMHGEFRIPTLVGRADALARGNV